MGSSPIHAQTDSSARPARVAMGASAAHASADELSDLIAEAARNNPGLAASAERWAAARERGAQARALPDPVLNYAFLPREVETRVGPQRQKLGLSQSIPWFGTLSLRGAVADQAAESERHRHEAGRLRLAMEVTEVYAELYYLGRVEAITAESLELLQRLEDVVRARYRTGGASNSALIRSQVERGVIEDRLAGLVDLRRPLGARLNALLGRPLDATPPAPTSLPVDGVIPDAASLERRLVAGNPELQALRSEVRRQELGVDLAGKQSWPNLKLGVEYMETGPARMPGVPDSGRDPLALMLSLNLPIHRGKYAAAKDEAAAHVRAAEHRRRDGEDALNARLQMALYGYREAERKAALYGGSLVPQGEQALAVTEEAFRAGSADFNSLIDAERVLLEFRLAHERAVADRAQRLAEIAMITGTSPEGMER